MIQKLKYSDKEKNNNTNMPNVLKLKELDIYIQEIFTIKDIPYMIQWKQDLNEEISFSLNMLEIIKKEIHKQIITSNVLLGQKHLTINIFIVKNQEKQAKNIVKDIKKDLMSLEDYNSLNNIWYQMEIFLSFLDNIYSGPLVKVRDQYKGTLTKMNEHFKDVCYKARLSHEYNHETFSVLENKHLLVNSLYADLALIKKENYTNSKIETFEIGNKTLKNTKNIKILFEDQSLINGNLKIIIGEFLRANILYPMPIRNRWELEKIQELKEPTLREPLSEKNNIEVKTENIKETTDQKNDA